MKPEGSALPSERRHGVVSIPSDLVDRPLSPKAILLATMIFVAVYLGANRLHLLLCARIPNAECVPYWPISPFMPRVPPDFDFPSPLHLLVGAISVGIFALALRVLPRANYRTSMVGLFGLALILATTLTHGWHFGLARAAAGLGNVRQEYFADASEVADPFQFLQDFNVHQAGLSLHSSTHPPGAVLLFYSLQRLISDPAVIAIVIACLATALTVVFLHRIISEINGPATAGRLVFLYLLVPSVQIYYAASLDAVIAPLVVGSCVIFFARPPWWWIVSALSLILASFLTFGAVFILPVLIVFDLWRFRRPWRSLLLFFVLVSFYAVLHAALGFDYMRSFATASSLENPEGFRLFSEAGHYVMTRIEDVAGIVLFLGPFLTLIVGATLARGRKRGPLEVLPLLAIASFVLVLLMGAYRTGETARAALFMVSFLMLPMADWIAANDGRETQFRTLASLVFLQALVMQFLGDYWW